MSEYLIQDTTLQNIGGGIRAINGESGTYSPATMRTKLNGIKSDIDDSYTAVSGKGGTLPAARNSANLPAAIESIPTGSVLPDAETALFGPVPMPVKGDLITMDLGAPAPYDGFANQYRVLSINGNVAEVVAMFTAALTNFTTDYSNNTYAGKTLDTYLNTTWYGGLSATAKSAIVDKNIVQYQYSYSSSVYSATTHASYADYATKATKETVGDRHVYAIDVEDIEKYFGGTNSTPGAFSTADIWTLFYNQSTSPSQLHRLGLRSARADDSEQTFIVNVSVGAVSGSDIFRGDYRARPAFCIDLTKIAFTPYSE